MPPQATSRFVILNRRGVETTSHVRGQEFESPHLHQVYARVVISDAGLYGDAAMAQPDMRAASIRPFGAYSA